jgi:hypothetical protein
MKKIAIFTIAIFIGAVKSNSQITKKNWMVGGSGRLASQKETLNSSEAKGFTIELSPNVGYFFIDKFAGVSEPDWPLTRLNIVEQLVKPQHWG